MMKGTDVIDDKTYEQRIKKAAQDALLEAEQRRKQQRCVEMPPELGGYEDKPEPTRYNDWEKKGITSDF